MTHDDLIAAAAHYLKRHSYRLILRDVQATCVNEQPDVIAWKSSGSSVVIEAKASRADFRRDRNKSWRKNPEQGMGYQRYYAVPATLVPVVMASAKDFDGIGLWGVLSVTPKLVTMVKKSGLFTRRNEKAERILLVSAVCRVTEGWGRKMFGPSAPQKPDGDPPRSTARIIRELREDNNRLRLALRKEREHRDEEVS